MDRFDEAPVAAPAPAGDDATADVEEVELFLDLGTLPSELVLPEVGVVILLREIPPVLEEFCCVSDFGGFTGDGGPITCRWGEERREEDGRGTGEEEAREREEERDEERERRRRRRMERGGWIGEGSKRGREGEKKNRRARERRGRQDGKRGGKVGRKRGGEGGRGEGEGW